ncbi:glycosyltransferase family 39 protein [Acrocarpospora corrugata]|uniref:glycosyltransferase family 39 protein n=1 Tax=Acrocarpospora corrugata TaxID=35763 RepID=UPI001479701D
MAAAVVGLWGVTTPSFWRDESVSALAASMPFGDLWRLLDHIDRVHALYYLILRPFAAVSTGELALRLPSVLATVAAAYGIVVLGRRLVSPRAGLLAGLVFVALPMVSRYAQEARSYAIVTAVAVLSTWLLVEAVRREHRGWYAGYAASLILLGWFHVYALLLVFAHAITVAYWRRGVGRFGESLALAGVGILPLAFLAVSQRDAQLGWLKPPTFAAVPTLGDEIAGNAWVALPLLVLVICGAVRDRRLAVVAVPWALLPVLSMAISQLYPVYSPRYLLFAVPAMALLAGAGLDALRPRALTWLGLALVVALTVPAHLRIREPDSRPDDLRGMALALQARGRPGDAVLYVNEFGRLFAGVYDAAYRDLRDLTYPPDRDTPRTAPELTAALAGVDRIWVVTGGRKHQNSAFAEDDERYLALMADPDFTLESTEDFGYSWFGLYVRDLRKS